MTRSQTQSVAQSAQALSPFNWRGKPSIFMREVAVAEQIKSAAQERREELARRNEQIATLYANGTKRKDLAREYNLTTHSISEILRTTKGKQ